jgi:hypothetical protein
MIPLKSIHHKRDINHFPSFSFLYLFSYLSSLFSYSYLITHLKALLGYLR